MAEDFFRSIVDELNDEDVHVMADGKGSAEFTGYIDTGCFMLNALVSGSLFGGMADNKVLTVAGESSTGKSFFALGIVKSFLDQNPSGAVLYYDTESAVVKKMAESRGIDTSRVIIGEPQTLQDFRTKCLSFLEKYASRDPSTRPPLLIVLDSLGMLSSIKEIADTAEGKDTRDMTKAQLIRGIFRVLRLKLAKLHVPMIVTAHTYASVGSYYPTQELSGGGGAKYSSDSILMIKKSKDKDGTDVVGVIIKGSMYKSRLSRENQQAAMQLSYDTGLNRYYGLLEFAEECGAVDRVGNKYAFPHLPDQKFFKKAILEDPEKFWTREMLELLEPEVNKKFMYGSTVEGSRESFDPETGEVYS